MILNSPARTPGGIPVGPADYEINHDRVMLLLVVSIAVLAVGFLLVVTHENRPSARWAIVCLMIGTPILVFHPVWTVSSDGGGGSDQVVCSWVVLGIEIAMVGVQCALFLWRSDAGNSVRVDYDDRPK